MFDLGWSKILILAVVAIVVVGPKELPVLLRTLGQFIAQLRRHAADFRAQFDEAMRSTELDQIRKDVEAIKTDAHASIRGIGQSLEQEVAASKASVEQTLEAADARLTSSSAEPPAIAPSAAVAIDTAPITAAADVTTTPASASVAAADVVAHAPVSPDPISMPEPMPRVVPAFESPAVPEPAKTGA